MRETSGGIAHTASALENDLIKRNTGLHKPHIKGLADLAAGMLACRSVNTSELLAVLPRQTQDEESRFRYINRWLKNPLIDPLKVMGGFVPQLINLVGAKGERIMLMMDQSKISDGFECLMISIRMGKRAVPVAWIVKEVKGNIGFADQKELLDAVAAMVPEDTSILLAADRFYGTAALIRWCQDHQWHYRLRLKGNLILQHEGQKMTTGEAAKTNASGLMHACLNESGVSTHIGFLHEEGHPEPWIIAMSDTPSRERVLDYGKRWGIEAMFSDFKSRGFGITQTQLKHADRIERLILVLAVALYWAVSAGMAPSKQEPNHTKKN
jgi:hypothetical protein